MPERKVTYSTTAPANPSEGDGWIDTITWIEKIWNGADWKNPGLYTQGCRVDRNSPQIIDDATTTDLIFDAEDYDTDEMHDLVVNPERITIKTAGIYLIVFHGSFQTNSTGYRRCYLYKNASTIDQMRKDADALTWTSFNLSTIYQCDVGDYLRVRVYQDSGAPLEFYRASHYSPFFMAQRIG